MRRIIAVGDPRNSLLLFDHRKEAVPGSVFFSAGIAGLLLDGILANLVNRHAMAFNSGMRGQATSG